MEFRTLKEEIEMFKRQFPLSSKTDKQLMFNHVCDMLLEANNCALVYEKYLTPEQIQEAAKDVIKMEIGL